MKTLAIANQKGGVGKSTLTAHLAYAAHEDGKRVLMVDMDRQGSLSMTFPSTGGHGIVASQLYLPALPADAAIEMVDEGLGIVRADAALLEVDRAENSVVKRPRAALQQFADQFDLCLIDTPPLLGMRLLASLAAADYVVTPLSIGVYELAGLGDLMQTMQALRQKGVNQHAKHIGFLPVNTNTRSTAERDGLAMLRQRYGDAVLIEATLPSRAAVKKAVAARKPVWHSTQGGGHLAAGKEWRAACRLILKRVK